MLGIFETELLRSLCDGGPADKQLLGTLHHESADVRGGCVACHFTDEVAEIVGREKERLHYTERTKFEVKNAVKAALGSSKNWRDFIRKLQQRGVEAEFKRRRGNDDV